MRNQNLGIRKYLLVISLLAAVLFAQDQDLTYMSQKMMLENNLRQRVDNALSRLLEDIRYVVDVNVEVGYSVTVDSDTVYEGTQSSYSTTTKPLTGGQTELVPESSAEETVSSRMSLPLPGFETPEALVQENDKESEDITLTVTPKEEKIISHQVQTTKVKRPVIKYQYISVILEDGVTPEIIENVRQVVTVASHYNQSRGDIINILTTAFQKKEKEDDAEAVILKHIAEKIDELEARQRQAEREAMIQKKKEQEQQAMKRDSVRIAQLNQQIEELKQQMTEPDVSEAVQDQTLEETQEREEELKLLQQQLAASNSRLQELEKGIIDNAPLPKSVFQDWKFWLALVLIIIALAVVLIVLFRRRDYPQRQEMDWGYNSQIPLSHRNPAPLKTEPAAPQQPVTPPVPSPAPVPVDDRPMEPVKAKTEPEPVQDDLIDSGEEMKTIRQSLISMTVGQPDKGVSIINNWLDEDNKTDDTQEGVL